MNMQLNKTGALTAYSIFLSFMTALSCSGQGLGFECDASLYIVSYTQSTGVSTLYKVSEEDRAFSYTAIDLSEQRRLTSLAYNVLDKYLYALDVDSYELVKIDRTGKVTPLVVPASIDKEFDFNGGTISPDGAGIFLIGFNKEFGFDNRFYTINLSRDNFYAGYLGVTGESRSEIHDFATDPLSGEIYGYDNLEGSLAQIGVGGQISSSRFPTTGMTSMDGVFFNQKGELFGYSAQSGFYAIDKLHGNIEFITSGPQGTHGDACSCPYTSVFEKDITPREILPCQEFEITYTFQNRLGIGQTWVKVRDTLPEGFEILDIESDIVTSINIVESPANILALDNLIYLMRKNEIKVTVRAPSDYLGSFDSRATQWDFPQAFKEYHYSDDPMTEELDDATIARIVTQEDIDFSKSVGYSCDGSQAVIGSPIDAEEYEWSTGGVTSSIVVEEAGWYTLQAENDCIIYFDSVLVTDFPEEKKVSITGPEQITIGESAALTSSLDRGNPISYEWLAGEGKLSCEEECASINVTPTEDTNYKVVVTDDEGCITIGEWHISVEQVRYFYAATAFSPNGDGVNDSFFLQSSVGGKINEMKIYSRWGSEVFSAKGIDLNVGEMGWDGKVGNYKISSGVYVWVAEIEYFDGLKEKKTGTVTLVVAE